MFAGGIKSLNRKLKEASAYSFFCKASSSSCTSGPRYRQRQLCGHAPYKARPLCRSHYNKASILGFATEQFIMSPRWIIIILSKYCIPISEKTQNMTKTSIFCRFFSFDDSKRHFLSDCQNKIFDSRGLV